MDKNKAPDLTLDYHAHILPGCDHGSDGTETSLRQLEMARAAGVKTVCATPHFYPHKEDISAFLSRRQKAYQRLQPQLRADDPQLRLGAEVLICQGMERMDELPLLCLEGSQELLLEMPFYQWPNALWDTLQRLQERQDVQLIIAHADRYPPEDIQELIQAGIPLQLNATCLTKPLRKRRYLSWIKAGYVRYLGSDIHMCGNGYEDFARAAALLRRNGIGES